MSVRTTFDEHRDKAIEKINEALRELHVCLNPNTWGFDDMRREYLLSMVQAQSKLLECLINLS